MMNNDDNADDVISLVQLCGLPGYKAGPNSNGHLLQTAANSEDLAVHELIRESGLAGYDSDKLATRCASASTPPAAPSRAEGRSNSTAPMTTIATLSKRQFLVLDVSHDGETALTALESKMGVSIAVDRLGKPSWVAEATKEGGSRRAFSFMAGQVIGFADLLGDLGTSTLRLSVANINLAKFKAVGSGVRDGEPPQWPDSLNGVLRSALGKVR